MTTLAPGARLGRYELLRPMAEGGMGAVWLAHQHGPHDFRRLVAVKVILPQLAFEPGFREMLLDEARVASRIAHDNVAQVLDVGEADGVVYLVMEWIEGDSLLRLEQTVLRKGGSLPEGIALRVLADACAGLHAAHELRDGAGQNLGVVHRDVSPQNLLVTSGGVTKLIDFGIAKAQGRLSRETAAGIVKGKFAYMAPEQALAMPLDRRVDVWAVGAIFYRIAKGKPPYTASNPIEAVTMLQSGRLKDPLSDSPEIHAAIVDVIERALSPLPSRRYATAAEMGVALEGAMTTAGITTSAADVEAFFATHLRTRREARREGIRIALEEAATRDASRPAIRTRRASHGRLAAIVAEIDAGRTPSESSTSEVRHESEPPPK